MSAINKRAVGRRYYADYAEAYERDGWIQQGRVRQVHEGVVAAVTSSGAVGGNGSGGSWSSYPTAAGGGGRLATSYTSSIGDHVVFTPDNRYFGEIVRFGEFYGTPDCFVVQADCTKGYPCDGGFEWAFTPSMWSQGLVRKVTGEGEGVTPHKPEPHIMGLSPEEIDQDAYRAFMKELQT